MRMTIRSLALVVGAALTLDAALAGPPRPFGGAPTVRARAHAPGTPAGADGPGWADNFDSYAAGAGIIGNGGWVGWCGTGPDGRVSDAFARSAPNSLQIVSNSDVVQDWANITSGKWIITLWTYIPGNATGTGTLDGSINLMNNYCGTVNPDWSVSVTFSAGTSTVSTWQNTATAPLLKDQWVEYRCEVDLGADTFSDFYNNTPLDVNRSWSGGVAPGGLVRIDAVDCYSSTLNGMYFDDASLQEVVACYADCNGDGALTVADFGCFQTKFVAGDPYADCNGDGVRTVADFGCFQTKFVTGCP